MNEQTMLFVKAKAWANAVVRKEKAVAVFMAAEKDRADAFREEWRAEKDVRDAAVAFAKQQPVKKSTMDGTDGA